MPSGVAICLTCSRLAGGPKPRLELVIKAGPCALIQSSAPETVCNNPLLPAVANFLCYAFWRRHLLDVFEIGGWPKAKIGVGHKSRTMRPHPIIGTGNSMQ